MNRRAILVSFAVAGSLLVIAVFAAAWLLGTDSGLRFLFARAEPYFPGGLEIGAVSGDAAGPLVAENLRFETENFVVELRRVELEWQLAALLRARIVIDDLEASGLRFTARPGPPRDDEPIALPERIDLPVDILVHRARLDQAEIRRAADAQPLVVDTVLLEAQWTERALDIRRLEVRAPLADLDMAAELAPRGDYALDAELDFTLRLQGMAPLNGHSRAAGSLARLEVEQALASPYGVTMRATVRNLVRSPRFEGRLEIDAAELGRIRESLPAATLDARARFSGDAASVRLELDAEAVEPRLGIVRADFRGEISRERIAVERLLVERAGAPARIEAQGRIELAAAEPVVDVTAQWQALQWPLGDEPRLASERGALTVKGTLESYRAGVDAQLEVAHPATRNAEGAASTSGHVRLTGRGDTTRFDLTSVDVETLGGTLTGSAGIAWRPSFQVTAALEGRGLDPSALAPAWPGRIDLELRGEAARTEAGLAADVDSLRASGRLREQPLELLARGQYRSETLQLDEFSLRSGTTRISARGRAGDELDFEWSLASEDLGSLLPDAGGNLDGSGRATGPMRTPRIAAEVSGESLRYRAFRAGSLELDADLDLAAGAASTIELSVRDGEVPGAGIEDLQVSGAGSREDHTLELSAATTRGEIALGIGGSLDAAERYAFVLERLSYRYRELDPWTLREPSSGSLAAGSARVEPACLTNDGAVLCFEGRRSEAGAAAAFELDSLPLSLLAPLLPPALVVEGRIGGTGRIELAQSGDFEADIGLRTSTVRLLAPAGDGLQPLLEFRPGTVSLDGSPARGAELRVDLPLEPQGGIEAHASIPAGDGPLPERPLTGQLRADLPDIAFLGDFLPQVTSLRGRLAGDVGVSGSLEAPAIDGSLGLEQGTAMLEAPNIRLSDIHASVQGLGRGALAVEARATSGGGTLEARGTVELPGERIGGRLSIEGEDFRVMNTAEAEVYASPDLELALDGERLEVTGTVEVPRADIELEKAPQAAVRVSDDQVIVTADDADAPTDRALAIAARIRLVLGESVEFEGFGLTARLAGDMTIIEEPGEPTTATGEISVAEGRYEAYGQSLDIRTGKVLFVGGPIDQPGIDVRAVRRPTPDITVGVAVRGSLRRPELSLFSNPSMSESEQLSYLVLGRPLQASSAAESSALNRAALALGVRGGNYLTEQFGGKLGVDQIGFETEPGETNEQAALVVGKYLSPRLYVSYGVGLLEPVSTLRLEYTLSSRWRLVTKSSTLQSGGDLLYTIER
ncbi:MAG TPA: translocation/assembly module TamB domain-containing protein [Gammaproteobacteria bacterium]|nr:translocation/assembly module TamB domain-containing protein [Gammaproteobacteria bacterium]